MKSSEARIIGENLAGDVRSGDLEAAYSLLDGILGTKTPFSALDIIGRSMGEFPVDLTNNLLKRLAAGGTMGGWVVIASALREQLDRDFVGTIDRGRDFIIMADSWFGADIQGERVPGPALVQDLPATLTLISAWREDPNRWVRRTVGVSIHYWAKRSQGRADLIPDVEKLLEFISPMFCEWDLDAAKGIGWGLKTLGRYYPVMVTPWLLEQLSNPDQRYRAITLRKAMTYLPGDQRNEILNRVK